ncbi:peptidyl-prolyl cis-trans isomerase SurA [Nannocystis exedens]|uniref:peptidylprolyl isomerase n=1 Tax=Nannocystis exedens TaxID=54 RepID=A0A1I1V2J9_9BACT|nr:peptidylprolyl isomerase [Nannocystis exedens]PCC72302.1 Foldase protein PrsA precursor [Nannocystis exedens]SFD77271.1 peptidyl-prolyl cis-trans isomerase SurA [Nannocystis exedens]
MTRAVLSCLVLLLAACDGGAAKPGDPPAEPAKKVEAPPPARAEAEAPPAPKYPQGEADEACAKIVVVAWQGAEGAEPTVTRDKAAAQARAEELRSKLSSGTAFAELAAESDEPKTKAKGGAMGTYAKDKWPEKYAPLKDVVFALGIGETSAVVEHPHGFVVAQRCKVEKVHTRHILVRYAGAKNAEAKIKRSKEEAQKLATELHAEASKTGADFEALAKKRSEDSSAERGGDLGAVGRGMFAPAFEAAAFALKPGEVSAVVETDFGFHVIQRVD